MAPRRQSCGPTWRPIAAKIIVLTTINQAGWVLFLLCPLEWRVPVFVAWFAVDVATPIVAGWDARMGGHRGHIVERYGLFTLIVLGESIAAATVAVGQASRRRGPRLPCSCSRPAASCPCSRSGGSTSTS